LLTLFYALPRIYSQASAQQGLFLLLFFAQSRHNPILPANALTIKQLYIIFSPKLILLKKGRKDSDIFYMRKTFLSFFHFVENKVFFF